MPEFDIKLNYSDGGLSENLKEQSGLYEKLTAKAKEYGENSSKANRAIGLSLNDLEVKAKAALGEFAKKNQTFTDLKKNAAEVALAIAKSGASGDKLIQLLQRVETAKVTGLAIDINNIEGEFHELISQLEITDAQLDFLVKNIQSVSEELVSISTQKATDGLKEAANAANEFSNELRDLSGQNLKEMRDRLDQLALSGDTSSDEFKQLAQDVGLFQARITQVDREVQLYSKSTDALSTALGELEDRMYDLALNGQQNTKEFKDLRDQVVRMKTAIVDVDKQVDRFVDKKSSLASFSEGVQLVGAAFQFTEGVTAAFGEENEELQKSLLRLNGVMAITSSIEQARNILIEQARTKTGLYAVATTTFSLAQKASNVAMGAAVGLKKLFTGQLKLEAVTTGAAAAAHVVYNAVVGKSTGVMKLFRIALASTGVGLLVIGIAALVANWDKLNSSMGFFNKLANAAKGVVAGLMTGLSGVGNVIATLFTGGGVSGAIAAAKKLGQDMGKAANDAFAKANQADKNKSIADFTDGLVAQQKKRLDLIKAQGKETGTLQSSILQNELVSLKLRGAKTEEIEEKQHELAISIAEREREQAEKRQEARQKANEAAQKAREKELELQQKYKDEILKLNDEITNAQRANALGNIDDTTTDGKLEKLELQKKYDEEDLKRREEQSLKIARSLEERTKVIELYNDLELYMEKEYEQERIKVIKEGRQAEIEEAKRIEEEILKDKENAIKSKIDKDRKASEQNLEIYLAEIDRKIKYGDLEAEEKDKLEREKLEITKRYLIAQRQLLGLNNPESTALTEQIKDIEAQLNYMDKNVAPRFKSIGEKIEDYMKDAFNINDDQIEALKEGFSALKDEVLGLVQSGFEAEIAAIDASIKAREDKISELEDLIQEEFERKEAGDSNYYDSLVAQKAKEEELLKQENAKKTEIQKTQLKVEAGIAAAQQVQALITAVANITKDGSKLGIFGIPLIAAGIISLFAIYRNFRAQAKSLGQTAYKGGKISDYLEPGQTAKSDRPGYGRGHKVEGTNLSIGADEYLINAVTTSKNIDFLDRLNDGEWDNVNLSRLMDSMPDRSKIINIYEKNEISSKTSILSEKQVRQIIQEQTDKILEADRRRPIIVNKPNGDTEIVTYTKSGAKKVKVLKKTA